jgi:hypothetical protein
LPGRNTPAAEVRGAIIAAAIAASAFTSACAVAQSETIPAWLKDKTAKLEALAAGRPPRAIYLATHEGKQVYYLTPTCCDIPSELYDADGKLLCYPSGGFAGGDGRCPAFVPDERRMRLVWRDKRVALRP